MKDKSYEERYQAYMEEGKKLMNDLMKKRKEIYEKYKNTQVPIGLDATLDGQECKELSHQFSKEVKKLKEKYGI